MTDEINSINKLFDYVIIDLRGDTLLTLEMQVGFKPKHSITLCTTVLKEIINYYVRRNSIIYCCFLDASKAFDKIHLGKLFKTLISKKRPSFSDQIIILIVIFDKKLVFHGVVIFLVIFI